MSEGNLPANAIEPVPAVLKLRPVEAEPAVTAKIVAFLRVIGLEVQTRAIDGATVLPGIAVEHGVLIYDPAQLQFPATCCTKPATSRSNRQRPAGRLRPIWAVTRRKS